MLVKLSPLTCCLFIPLAILCVLRSEKVFGFPFHSYRDAVLNRFGTKGLPGSRVASPFGFTPKKVLGIESCGNLRLWQLQNRLQTLWSSYQTIDFEPLKTELTGRPPDVASGAWGLL